MTLIHSVLDGALQLASHGLYVVRLHYPIFDHQSKQVRCSCGRSECSAEGKHPVGAQWGKSATTDADSIRDFWREADWNVGVLLGLGHGIPEDEAIIDIEDDTTEGRQLADVMLRDCPTVSWTSGKSVHRIYRWDPRLPQVANMTVSGLEFRFGGRGKETQSVAPPSAHKSGRRYMFVEGRNLEQIAIARLPDHVIEWICERYAEQANSPSGSPSSADYRRFRTPGKKIQEPGRNNALVRFANSAWRDACKLYGLNRLEESEVRDQVWMWVMGANLVTCEPPLGEEEAWSVFQSSERFMRGELLREAQEKAKQAAELADPQPIAEAGDESKVDLDASKRSAIDWMAKYGIRMSFDPMCPPGDKNPDRVDEWQCDWKLSYVRDSDQELISITIQEVTVLLTPTEFESPRVFARKMALASGGKILLDRTFAHYSWKSIWDGMRSKDQNGITRGLREYLVNSVVIEDAKSISVEDQVMGIVYSLAGNVRSICSSCESFVGKLPQGRMKMDHAGSNVIFMRAPEDPRTGVYHLGEGELRILLAFEEVSRKFRGSYGNTLTTSQLSDALENAGFRKERIRSGPCEGRWFSRKVAKVSENELQSEGE